MHVHNGVAAHSEIWQTGCLFILTGRKLGYDRCVEAERVRQKGAKTELFLPFCELIYREFYLSTQIDVYVPYI